MKSKISSRDIKFFFFGVLFMFLLSILYDWQDFKAGVAGAFTPSTEITK